MQCLVDYVGPFQGCYAPAPLSGMFLSQLPGIEFKNIDQISNAEQQTWVGLWADLQASCADTFREDVIAEFGKRYQLKQITQTVDLGKKYDTTILTAPTGVRNGVILETLEPGSQCTCSNMFQLYVQSVSFYWKGVNPVPALTLYFQDADLLTTEKTTVVTGVVPGWNTVWVDQSFVAKRLYVIADGNFDNYVNLSISDFNLSNFGGYTWGMGQGYINFTWGGCGCQSRLQGASFNTANQTGVFGTNTFGLSVVFSTKCQWDVIVCNNKRHFASAWQHALAIELCNYRINSSRINRWTTIDKEQAKELQKLLSLKYRGGVDPTTGISYPGKLQSSITAITVNDMDCCVKNNDYIIWREQRM